MAKTFRTAALLAAFVAVIISPALADRTNLQPAWNLFTPQQDIEMGRLLAEDAQRSLSLVDEHNANVYLDALGKQLAVHAPGTRYPYQFKIVSNDSVNAWALPGGYIYVTAGLIEQAQNEPQLAGYLAHAIAHTVLRHGTAEVSRAYSGRSTGSARRVNVNDVMSRLNIRFESREPDTKPPCGATDSDSPCWKTSQLSGWRITQRRSVGGAQAVLLELTNDSPIGGTERIWLVTVQRPGGLLRYFAGVAPQRDFNRYRDMFEQIVNSTRLLD